MYSRAPLQEVTVGLKRLLPSFSSEDDDDFNTAQEGGDVDETDEEVTFKNQNEHPKKRLRIIPAAQKNLNLIRENRPKGPTGFQKVAATNRAARMMAVNETKRGWHKKAKKKAGAHRNKPGIVALWEIRFYQKSRVLLIPMRPFICFVHELTREHTPPWGDSGDGKPMLFSRYSRLLNPFWLASLMI